MVGYMRHVLLIVSSLLLLASSMTTIRVKYLIIKHQGFGASVKTSKYKKKNYLVRTFFYKRAVAEVG